jgi:long-chain acyl-CoA synthetase
VLLIVVLKYLDDLLPGVVGPPVPSVETKLVDIPDMGYFSTDKPYPRGELLVRGINVTAGYYQNEEETKKVYIEDGWFATGDVAEQLPSGSYKIIDRKKNLVKLAGGEYIALERLESLFKHSDFVENVCVYGDSSKQFPVAIVVPNRANLEKWAEQNEVHEHDYQALCENEKVVEAVTNSLKETGMRSHQMYWRFIEDCIGDSMADTWKARQSKGCKGSSLGTLAALALTSFPCIGYRIINTNSCIHQ